jgi:DUF1680 family protein
MLLITGEARFAEIMEREIFNGFLGSMDHKSNICTRRTFFSLAGASVALPFVFKTAKKKCTF